MQTIEGAWRETFSLRTVSGRMTVLSISVLAFVTISIVYPAVFPYLVLYFGALLIASISKKRDFLLNHPAWKLKGMWKPLGLGLLICLPTYSMILILTDWKTSGTWQSLLLPTLAWGVMVGLIETFTFQWVAPAILPYGPVLSSVIFGALHPAVRESLMAGNIAGLWFFVGYLLFGLFMCWLVYLYDKRFKGHTWFGPILAITVHACHNAFATIWTPMVGGMQLVPY